MASWPFDAVDEPNADSGYVTLTGSYVDVPILASGVVRVFNCTVHNPTGAAVDLYLKDAAGVVVVPGQSVGAGEPAAPNLGIARKLTAPLQWKGSGLVARLEGWQ